MLFRSTHIFGFTVVALLAGCSSDVSLVQKESPANAYKDYAPENARNASVIGVGEPISTQKMRANATMKLSGLYNLENIMDNVAGTYNVAVRWGAGVRKSVRESILINELTFDEARSYIEDVYDVQIIREGERRLLVLPSVNAKRITEFNPGVGVTLGEVLRGLASQCGTNLVITENDEKLAETRVTTRFQDITCHDAYTALLAPQGLSLTDKGGYALISGLPKRQWTLDLYEPEREEETEVSYQSEFEGSNEESGGGGQSAGGSSKVTITKSRNLWAEIEADLSSLLSTACAALTSVSGDAGFDEEFLTPPSDGVDEVVLEGADEVLFEEDSFSTESETNPACGYVRVNKSVGLIQMQGTYDMLEQADDLITRVQEIASRRLLLEARVLAVTRSREFKQGSNFSGAANDDYNTIGTGFNGSLNSIAATLSGRLATLNEPGIGFLSVKSNALDAVVGFVEEYGTTYQLMQPMMELMDRQRATLIDGTNRVYYLRETEVETVDGLTTRNTRAETFNQFAGLQFSATAQVSEGNEPHTISLQIPITDISGEEAIPQVVDGQTLNDRVPIVSTRLIDQKVRLRDGEIKVIGGLTKTIAVDKESGVPLMRDIPALGTLFNEEDIEFEEVEFVVLLQVRRLY